jgi:hypothetical protein
VLAAPPGPARRVALLAVAAAAASYVFPYYAVVNNPNENARFYMTASLVEEGTYAIDAMRDRWGWVNDCAVYEGHVYSVKAPGTSFLGVPAYAAYLHGSRLIGHPYDRVEALWWCRAFATILPWLLFLAWFHPWLGRFTGSPLVRDSVFVAIALGSCLYGYALLFVSHVPSAVCAIGAFALLFDAHRAGGRITRPRSALAGLLTAGITFFEYPGLIASAGLTLYAFAVLRRRAVPFVLAAAVPTLLVMHFQGSAFDNPFTPGHRYMETAAFRAIHVQGLFGATEVHWESYYVLLLHPGKGLFPMTPVLLGALWGFWRLLRRATTRRAALVVLGILGATMVAVSFQIAWDGGWVVGPRYLVLFYPFLAWAAVHGWDAVDRRWPGLAGPLLLGLTVPGLLLSTLPAAYYPHLPPEISRPLSQVVVVLVGHGYAPHNLGQRFGLLGTASMVPFFALLVAAWLLLLGTVRRARARAALGGAAVAALVAVPLAWDPSPEDPDVRRAVAFVTEHWDPAGEDRAARLAARMAEAPEEEGLRRLAELYRREGRDREASSAERRADRVARRPRR